MVTLFQRLTFHVSRFVTEITFLLYRLAVVPVLRTGEEKKKKKRKKKKKKKKEKEKRKKRKRKKENQK